MRVGFGAIIQTSNSFSASRTSLDDFRRLRLATGAELRETDLHDSVCAALARSLDDEGDQTVPLIEALVISDGPLSESAFEGIWQALSDGVAQAGRLDRIVLHLSGNTLIEGDQPAQSEIMDRLAATYGSNLPAWLILDSLANPASELFDRVQLVLSRFARSDSSLSELSARVRDMALGSRGQIGLHTCHRGPFYLIPLSNQRLDHPALQRLVQVRDEVERSPAVIAANISLGFPYADTPSTGVSIWATATSEDSARMAAARIQAAVEQEEVALSRVEGLFNIEEAIHAAMANAGSTSILLDTGDDPAGGAPGDGTGLLWGLLDLGARDALLAPMVDANAVARAFAAGKASRIEMEVGARLDRRHGYPVQVRAEIVRLLDSVPMFDAGRIAIVRADGRHDGSVLIVLSERRVVIDDLGVFRSLGIDRAHYRMLAIKASISPKYAPEDFHGEPDVMLVATPGITVPNFDYFQFRHLRSGIMSRPPS